ncbi:carbohydrate esterase family 1 protein [Parathielavia appendiculata]|uniref:Carboxylic ester hydrolase n=1 Tax=Parathielavia appendiculata TaxID=2587402 RepID=A0AAN6YXY7_9PEZI|nr:carbohydrate esterase family 1 protein [Parathielavia appendiculata]
MFLQTILGFVATAATCLGASLQQVSNFGRNPTNIQMFIYVPDRVATNPAIIVALHGCGGTGQQWFSGTRLPSYADSNGFILIYPSTPNQSNCWDVQNPASLTHGQGGDALGIVSMVNYTIDRYAADRARVYVMGFSSGGMMTNVLAGSYPDVFEAGAAYSGVPHACFLGAPSATPFSPNQTCAQGLQKPAQEWGNLVRNSFPGYTGRRPRMQITHGLADTLVRPQCAFEALKQWSNVLGVEFSRNVTGVPSAGWTQQVYGDGTKLQGFFGQGVGHTPSVNEAQLLKFFGLIN